MSEKYLVDTNFWITCENDLYPRRHFPSFWKEIEEYLAKGTILHHWAVAEELKKKDDEISKWFSTLIKQGAVTVIARPKETPESYIEVCTWPQIISKVKIPDVCAGMGISCLNFNEFFDAIDLVV